MRRSGSSSTGSSSSSSSSSGGSSSGGSRSDLGTFFTAHLEPAALDFVPVQYALLDDSELLDGGNTSSSTSSSSTSSSSSTDSSTDSSSSGTVGYVKIVAFSSTVPNKLDAALRELVQAAGSSNSSSSRPHSSPSSSDSSGSPSSSSPSSNGLGGLILDLRDNPGGDVDAGVEAARDFLSEGDLLAV